MPKIEVWKTKEAMVPVSEAQRKTAYKCPWTKKLFRTKPSYVNHLKELREKRMHRNARCKRNQKLGYDFWNQPTFEKIIEWVELHTEWFVSRCEFNGRWEDQQQYQKALSETTIRITHLKLNWREHVSNSHSCPHNGTTNWGARENRPTGYPGWHGRIEYQICSSVSQGCFGFNIISGTRIHTGSGGGISNGRYGYDVKFFADDWPGLMKTVEAERATWERQSTIDILKNNYRPFKVFGINYGKPVYFR